MAYLILSRIGMSEGVEIGRGKKPLIWTFGGCHQSISEYFCPSCPNYNPNKVSKEKRLMAIFYPLIQGDRLLGNYHLLDKNIPDLGG